MKTNNETARARASRRKRVAQEEASEALFGIQIPQRATAERLVNLEDAVARWRGLAYPPSLSPGLADWPWARGCRPLARACGVWCALSPSARGLALG
jgi:hypothetical protein